MDFIFERKINYYETDRMGIVHHSNYIRFMEEARTAFLNEYELPYNLLEESGIIIPTINVNCTYKNHVTFGDTISIKTYLKNFNGIRLMCGYTGIDKDNNTVFTAESSHCFTNSNLKPINLKKVNLDIFNKFEKLIEE